MYLTHNTLAPAQHIDDPLHRAQRVLQQIYGYTSLRSHQRDVLKPFLNGRDTLAVIPTGGGKSMCYVLPAMMSPGVGVVISPLISLIRNQVIQLRGVGVPAAALDSMQSLTQKNEVMAALHNNLIKVLYISPERLALSGFRQLLTTKNLCYLAVDEAHCVSEWGSDFRPEYRKLGRYFNEFSATIPRLAVTATATAKVRQDIVQFLGLRAHAEVIRTPIRENLKIETKKLTTRSDHVKEIRKKLADSSGQGIIYTFSRKNAQRLATLLNHAQVASSPYHAGLTPRERDITLTRFLASELKVVVATNAFGLGIDKKDVRFVHHYGLPPSLESYVQQIGRAGRDGKASLCCLFFQSSDANVHRYICEQSYPSTAMLTKLYTLLTQQPGQVATLKDLSYAMFHASPPASEKWNQLIRLVQILERERLVSLSSPDPAATTASRHQDLDESSCIKVMSAAPQFTDFINMFSARKRETQRKLAAMEQYAYAHHNRNDVIRRYFDSL